MNWIQPENASQTGATEVAGDLFAPAQGTSLALAWETLGGRCNEPRRVVLPCNDYVKLKAPDEAASVMVKM